MVYRRLATRLRDAATMRLLTASGVRARSRRAAGVPSDERSIFFDIVVGAGFFILGGSLERPCGTVTYRFGPCWP